MSTDNTNSIGGHVTNDPILPNLDQICQVLSDTTNSANYTFGSLKAKHQADIAARGLLPKWAAANCMTCDIPKAKLMLGYEAYSEGILLMSDCYGQLQFRPDIPWSSKGKEDKEPPKYRTPKHEYDLFLAKHPEIEAYWGDLDALKARCFTIGGKPYLLITEGGFKAIMGCQHDIPTVAGVGVTMFLTPKAKGEPDLVPALKRLAEAGFNFIIAFDSDKKPETIKNVRYHELKLAKILESYGCNVRTVTGKWNYEDGKGMDDFIQNKGIEAFREILMKAENHSEPITPGEGKKRELPPPSRIAEELAETYRDKLAWESEYQLWRHYSAKYEGLWGIESVETIKGLIHAHLRSKDLPGFNAGYISSIATILQSDLEVTDWDEQAGLIPLRDGVLNQLTQELKPHKPGYRFTWQLPFKWADRAVGCKPIEEFFLKITGSQDIANVLLAICAAVVTRRADLQRFVEFIGGGGTGKSTCMAILRALAGSDNTVSSQLKHLENNQFETAKFYGKILALFPDSERWQGEISVLKQLTGQDPIRYERKGVQQCKDFIFNGMVVISANEAPESRDLTSGAERRKLTINLDTRVQEYQDRNLIKEFEPYLPGLLKLALDIPREEVTRLVKHTDREVPALAAVKWRQLCETNPIAGWLDEKIILSPDAKAYVGQGDIEQAGRWLFANFCKWQQESGHRNTATLKWFSKNLRDLLKNQMKAAVTEHRDRDGNYIQGIGLRCLLDPTGIYPRSVTKMPFCDGLMLDNAGLVTDETTGSAGFAGYAGFLQNSNDTENFQIKIPPEIPKNQSCPVDGDKNPAYPSNPALPMVSSITNPSQRAENPSQPRILEIGDRVVVKDVSGRYQGVRGIIVATQPHSGGVGVGLVVKFDKKVAFCQQCEFMAGDLMPLPPGH